MDSGEGEGQQLHIELNVKSANANTGGYSKESQNMNELFKLTCQRYHCYISQVIEFLKRKELRSLSGKSALKEDDSFSFVSST